MQVYEHLLQKFSEKGTFPEADWVSRRETGAGWAKEERVTRQRDGDALELMNNFGE